MALGFLAFPKKLLLRLHGLNDEVLMFGLAMAGASVGLLITNLGTDGNPESKAFAATSGFRVWSFVIAAQAWFWGLVVVPLWKWRNDTHRTFRLQSGHDIVRWVVVFSIVILVALPLLAAGNPVKSPLIGQSWRIQALMVLGIGAIVPAIVGIKELQIAAKDSAVWEDKGLGTSVRHLQVLQGRLRGALTVLGGMITLIVFSTTALFEAIAAFRGNEPPVEFVLLYGAFFAGTVAMIYLPAHTAVNARGELITDTACPLPEPSKASFLPAVEKREKLAILLGTTVGPRENLEKGLLILSPLLAGLISSFMPGQ